MEWRSQVTLAESGLAVGDLVTYDCDDQATGGIVYQIVKNCDPLPEGALVNEAGKKPKEMELRGYIRLKPLFEFFPSSRGTRPTGLGSTVLVHHKGRNFRHFPGYEPLKDVRKVNIVTLGLKYAELGSVIRSIAMSGGMVTDET